MRDTLNDAFDIELPVNTVLTFTIHLKTESGSLTNEEISVRIIEGVSPYADITGTVKFGTSADPITTTYKKFTAVLTLSQAIDGDGSFLVIDSATSLASVAESIC